MGRKPSSCHWGQVERVGQKRSYFASEVARRDDVSLGQAGARQRQPEKVSGWLGEQPLGHAPPRLLAGRLGPC